MTRTTDDEMDDLEHYLVGLDEVGNTISTEWATTSHTRELNGAKDVHEALQALLQDSVTMSKTKIA